MAIPMLSASTGYAVSGAFNGLSIFVTIFPTISLIKHYRAIEDKCASNEKTLETKANNESTDSKSFSYGEYTFTDNLKSMKRATITCLTSLFIRCIVSCLLDIARASHLNIAVLISLIILQSLLYFVGRTAIYYIFILRIMYSFKGNKFAVSRKTFIVLATIFNAMTLGFLALMMVQAMSQSVLLLGIIAAFAFICDTILSVMLLSLFLQRLKMISHHFGYSYNSDGDTEKEIDFMIHSGSDQKLSVNELNYINIIARYTLIAFIAIFSCVAYEYLVAADLVSIGINPSLNTSDEISLIKLMQWVLLPIDAMLNIWCIYFNNAFSTNIYYKVCGKCHQCCKKCST